MCFSRAEAARFRREGPEDERGRDAEKADRADAEAPAEPFRDDGRAEAADHAADRRAGDEKPHGRADGGRGHLFRDIGHRDRRDARKRDAGETAQDQQAFPGRRQCGERAEEGSARQRKDHHRPSADAIGDPAGNEDADGERAGGERDRKARRLGRHAEAGGEFREQRLGAVEQREGRKTRHDHGDGKTPIFRRPRLNEIGIVHGMLWNRVLLHRFGCFRDE